MESLNTAYSLTHLYHSWVRPYKAVIDRHQMCSAQKQREYMGMFYIYSSKISNVIWDRRSGPVWDPKKSVLIGLAHCGRGLGLAGLVVLWNTVLSHSSS